MADPVSVAALVLASAGTAYTALKAGKRGDKAENREDRTAKFEELTTSLEVYRREALDARTDTARAREETAHAVAETKTLRTEVSALRREVRECHAQKDGLEEIVVLMQARIDAIDERERAEAIRRLAEAEAARLQRRRATDG